MSTYKTAPLVDYSQNFQDVAAELFQLVSPSSGGKTEKGSYSFRMSNYSHEMTAKIVIYERGKGMAMRGDLPGGERRLCIGENERSVRKYTLDPDSGEVVAIHPSVFTLRRVGSRPEPRRDFWLFSGNGRREPD
jgi:hypothetical protein